MSRPPRQGSGQAYAEVIGDPISHSKSPLIHNFWLQKLRIDAQYRACHVRPEELAGYIASRREDPNWRGCNVTIPHKQAVVPLLDTVTRGAKAIGAVNTIHRTDDGLLHGRNSDVHGIWRALDGVMISEKPVTLIGAGGAARAAAFALGKLTPASVVIMNRSVDKAQRLLDEFHLAGEAKPLGPVPETALVINASSLGMTGQPGLPVSLGSLKPGAAVFDMVYSPLETPLLEEARSRGLLAIDGLTMLIEQAAEAFACFFRASAPRDHDAELRVLLTA